jgi:hypothetical protein
MVDYLDGTDFGKAINFGQPSFGIDPVYSQDYSGLFKGFSEALSGAAENIEKRKAIEAEERKAAEEQRKKISESEYLDFSALTNPNVKTEIIGQKTDAQGNPIEYKLTTDEALLAYNKKVDDLMASAPRANFMVYDENGKIIGAAETKQKAKAILGDQKGDIEEGDGQLYVSDQIRQQLAKEKFSVLSEDKRITQEMNLKNTRSKLMQESLAAVRNMNVDGNQLMGNKLLEYNNYVASALESNITEYGQLEFTPDVTAEIQKKQNELAAYNAAIVSNQKYANQLLALTTEKNINKDETTKLVADIAKQNSYNPLALQAAIASGQYQPVQRFDSSDVFDAISSEYKSTKKTSTEQKPLDEKEIIETIQRGIKEKDPVYVGYFGSNANENVIKETAKDYIQANTSKFTATRVPKEKVETPKEVQSDMESKIYDDGTTGYTIPFGNNTEKVSVVVNGTTVATSIAWIDYTSDGTIKVYNEEGAEIPYNNINKAQINKVVKNQLKLDRNVVDLKTEFERRKKMDEEEANKILKEVTK